MAYNKARADFLLTQEKTKGIIEELIQLNEGLIGKQLKKFGLTYDPDAISFAYEALYNAIVTYDPSKNSALSTYATVCIYNRLGSYVRSLNTQINLNTISYDARMTEDGTPFVDSFESELKVDADIMNREGIKEITQCFNECYQSVTSPMHRKIIQLWVSSNFGLTRNEVAEQLGCSQSYVSQVINKFRTKLKNKLEGLL